MCYCKAGINYPLVPLYKWEKGLVYAFFAYKLQALHLSEKPCGKLAFRNGSSDRYWAQARDRDGAKRSRGAKQGLKRMQDAPVRRSKPATETERKRSRGAQQGLKRMQDGSVRRRKPATETERKRSRGAQQGLKRMQDGSVRRRKPATETKRSKVEVRSRRISQYSE